MPSRLRVDFQPHELIAVLRNYDLGKIQRIDKQLKGSRRSPKVILTAEQGRFLLKRRARGRDHPLKVAYAHSVQRFLADRGFPVPRLIPTRNGEDTMVVLGDLIYEMFEFVQGHGYDGSLEATHDGGRVLAEFHEQLSDFESDWEPSRQGYHDNNAVRSNLNGIPSAIGKDDSVVGKESELLATVGQLFEAYESAAERVNAAGFTDWPVQIVHSDWHPGNMLFLKGQVTAVIDYDSLHLMPPITDVANGALQFSILGGPVDPRQWPPELDEDRFNEFLQGYDECTSFGDEHLDVLVWLMIEALVAEAVMPIAATGSFGRLEGFRFLQMITRKVHWLEHNGARLIADWRP